MTISIIKDILTGIDGESYDIARVSWVITTLALIGIEIGYLYTHPQAVFDVLNFGGALAANIGAHGGAIGFKARTEPQGTQPNGSGT